MLAVLLAVSSAAYAVTATWTGRQEQVQTVTGKIVWKCEYQFAGNYYYLLFENRCPSTVELQ